MKTEKRLTFPGQLEDEEVLLFLRRHWLSFLPYSLFFLFMLFLPLLIIFILTFFNFDLTPYRSLAIVFLSSFLLFAFAFFLTAFIDYYLDVTIVTNSRLIDIEQKGLFNRDISEQSLLRVQDVSSKRQGLFQTLFNYGLVFIQTAGEAPNFELYNIPKPDEVAQKILHLHEELLKKQEDIGGLEIKPITTKEKEERKGKESEEVSSEDLRKGGEVEL